MSAAFVGRRVELALLDSVCSRANADNRPAAALISGVPGSGKSRLLAELRSRRRATHVLGVVGYESAFQVPLGAAANLLRELGKVSHAGEMLSECRPSISAHWNPMKVFSSSGSWVHSSAHSGLPNSGPSRKARPSGSASSPAAVKNMTLPTT